jgi:hypothetical protein
LGLRRTGSGPDARREDHDDECRERNGKPAGDERADSEDAQHDAEDRAHASSL